MTKYKVVEQFHRGGMHRVGTVVELTDTEAVELAGFVVPVDGDSMPAATTQDSDLQEQIDNLNLQLGKECEAKHEYKNALDDLTKQIEELKTANHRQETEIADLQAENEQLKAAAAKPAAKGAK